MQLLVVGFGEGEFEGGAGEELKRLGEDDAIRLLDLLFVVRDEEGDIAAIERGGPTAAPLESGALVGALIGLGAEGEELAATAAENGSSPGAEGVWYLADAIPPGTAAAIALIEHRWAIPLRDAIEGAGGSSLADAWVHPRDLIAIGAARA